MAMSDYLASNVVWALRRRPPEDATTLVAVAAMHSPVPDDHWDTDRVFAVLQKIACPIVCVGYVNEAGWHVNCQRKAQEAMRALGLTPPDCDPIPTGRPDWDL